MSLSTTPPSPGSGEGDAAFVEIAPLYDMLMTGVPYTNWVAYLKQLLDERVASPRQILDLACGTGNVSELLTQEGYAVTGVDIAPGMIAEAKRKATDHGLTIDYHVQDAALLDLPGQRFDLCVSLFDSLNYITDPIHLQEAMIRVAAHLTRNGLFIFDLNSEYALVNHFFDQNNLHSNERLIYDWHSTYDLESRLCRVDMKFLYHEVGGTTQEFEEVHWQFAYRQEEIIAMLEQAGFDQIKPYKAYSLRQPVRHSDRIFYVARRP